MIRQALDGVRELALGGTAVGTGLNALPEFGEAVAAEISALTGKNFITAPNKFHALTSKDELVYLHGAFKALAADLMKIANDVRLAGLRPAVRHWRIAAFRKTSRAAPSCRARSTRPSARR